jgi:hypothetical protein
MGVITTGQTFSSGDQVTASKLNEIANLATFTSASDTTDDSTLTLGSSKLKVKDLGITSTQLAADSVITAKIQDGAVTSDKLDSNAVLTANIADSTGTTDGVTTAKIADEAVTSAKISSTDTELNYVNGGVGIGTLNETGYDLTATKVKLKGTATQLFFEDTDEAGTPTEIAISLNSKALRFGFQDAPTTQALQIFGRNLAIAGGTVAQMNALTADDGALTGNIAYVSNGNAGNPCLAMYDGSAWKVIATLGSTISAS